ncbi:hypothetical protein I302_102382 [Kwoniella bestiolae CBS 10118]|uniref:Mediator of RNA polymerase II transcription subunit 19 n=1 Tax=Kwoniella bestiolae CBS 10118 TaxID=1296100 RepID=A0A1B9GF03_9TREE|nr:hypothetical protein I302_01074 [Kwoniella bestiolae CBS 10118]OCF29566.1 hypothetical protein I302_01074 [Kwoniella bestiolae CBS 10118]
MDLIQNGESSRSPRTASNAVTHGDTDIVMDSHESRNGVSSLILPQWDVPPTRHLHSSLDLISLLHLDTLYNDYVRPYAEINPEDLEKGQQHRRRKLEKGYWHLIEDCIDPTPTGTKLDNQSLLPISQDLMLPTGPPPNLYADPIEMLPDDAFQVAKLEAGHKEDGYSAGVKLGVREAEEKRRRKKANKLSLANPKPPDSRTPAIPSPGIPSPSFSSQPRPGSTPGTPLLPVPAPSSSKSTFGRKPSFPSSQGVKPFGQAQGQGQGRPYNPNKRPGSSERQLQGQGQQQKKFKSGSVGPSTVPYRPAGGGGSGSRSASPMPLTQLGGQGQKLKQSMRSKTEGV